MVTERDLRPKRYDELEYSLAPVYEFSGELDC